MYKLILIILIIFSCQNRNIDTFQDNPISNSLSEIINQTIDSIPANKNILFYEKLRKDSIQYWLIEHYVENSNDQEKILLAKELLKDFEQEPQFSHSLIHSDNFIISTDHRKTDSLLSNHKEKILGFINMSKFVLNSDSSRSCVFYNPNLGEYGGGAYLIFLKKNNNWQVEEIKLLANGK